MKNGDLIIDQVAEAVSHWKSLSKDSGVTNESTSLIQNKIQNALDL